MKTAGEVMHAPAPVVAPDTTLQDLYAFLDERDLDGACVVDDGHLVGVVTSMDLVVRQKRVHLPTLFAFMDVVLPLGGTRQTEDELRRIASSDVGGLATRDVVTIDPDTPLDEVATLMVEKHLTVLPVVEHGGLVGMVTKDDVLRGTFGR